MVGKSGETGEKANGGDGYSTTDFMTGLKGNAEYSVDSKGRVAIPAKFRNALNPDANSTFTVISGLRPCVQLYPADVWEEKAAELKELNQYRQINLTALRLILMNADDQTLDKQGRVMLGKQHLDAAGIDVGEKALMVGMLDHIEMWNPERFWAEMNAHKAEAETLVETVMGGM